MKLNPPASSSDLAAARAIARRLHQKAFGTAAPSSDSPVEAPRGVEPPRAAEPVRRPAPPPLPPRKAPPPPARPPSPPEPRLHLEATPPGGPEEPTWTEPPPRRGPWAEEPPARGRGEPARPSLEPPPSRREEWPSVETADAEQEIEVEEPEPTGGPTWEEAGIGAESDDDALADLTGGGPSEAERHPREPPEEPSFEETEIEAPSFGGPGIGSPGLDEPELEAPGDEPPAYEPTPYEEPAPAPPGVSPEDLIGGPEEPPAKWADESPLDAEIEAAVGGDTGAEDLVEVQAPSWDIVVGNCLALAGTRGAMLVEASGQVLAAQGDWPNPGPEPIASRLVTMMDRALRDAPTRSVSAPLAGQHLTAWRVSLGEKLVTTVFIGDAPLKADVRPAIDDEIRRGAGV